MKDTGGERPRSGGRRGEEGGGERAMVVMMISVDGGGLDGRRGEAGRGGGYGLRLFWREASVMVFSRAS